MPSPSPNSPLPPPPARSYLPPGEQDALVEGLLAENRLRARIGELQAYRRMGLRTLGEVEELELERGGGKSKAAQVGGPGAGAQEGALAGAVGAGPKGGAAWSRGRRPPGAWGAEAMKGHVNR
jgi:hypothetical protein